MSNDRELLELAAKAVDHYTDTETIFKAAARAIEAAAEIGRNMK